MTLQDAAVGAQLAAAVAGVALALRRPAHRPAAIALVLLAAITVGEIATVSALRALPRPVEGGARALVYIDGALQVGGTAVVPGLAVAVCASRPRAALGVVAAWALVSVVLAVLYPSPLVRGDGLRQIYLATELIGLAVTALAFAFWRRVPRTPTPVHFVALLLAFLNLAVLLNPLGPWRAGLFGEAFDGPQIIVCGGFVALALFQGILCRFSSPSA